MKDDLDRKIEDLEYDLLHMEIFKIFPEYNNKNLKVLAWTLIIIDVIILGLIGLK